MALRVLELFAGCGGLAAGLSAAGFEHVGLVEMDPRAAQSLRSNACVGGWDADAIVEDDVRAVDLKTYAGVDLCAAGVPCQPFSQSGLGNGHEDPRNLFPALFDAIRDTQPKAVLVENVFGLLRPGFDEYFRYILDQMRLPSYGPNSEEPWRAHWRRLVAALAEEQAEYIVDHRILDAADYGTAQRRRRVFIQATANRRGAVIKWPEPTHSRASLERDQADGSYWSRHGLNPRSNSHAIVKSVGQPWRTTRDAIASLGAPGVNGRTDLANHDYIPGARTYHGHTGSDLDWPAKTIKAGVHGVAGGEGTLRLADGSIRYLTIREAARIQDLSDDYTFGSGRTRAMRQIGNAVPVRLSTALASCLAEAAATEGRDNG